MIDESVEYWEKLAEKLWPEKKDKEKSLRATLVDLSRSSTSKYLSNLESKKKALENLIKKKPCYEKQQKRAT